MDIVEQLARQAAETINGGEFYDGKWYTEGQRQAWRKAMTPVAQEIERLRQQVAELVKALQTISEWQPSSATQPRQKIIDNMQLYARLSIAKATGDK